MGKTYIFFEPKNEIFFETIVYTYCKLIKEYYKDAVKAHSKGESYKFFSNYIKDLLFPACDYNSNLGCKRTPICSPEKRPVLTDDQKELVAKSLDDTISELRDIKGIEHIVVDRIRDGSYFLLSTKTEHLPFNHTNILPFYLQLMKRISIKTDAEKLVYVSSEDSNYNYFKDEMLKSKPEQKTLVECIYY